MEIHVGSFLTLRFFFFQIPCFEAFWNVVMLVEKQKYMPLERRDVVYQRRDVGF